MNQTDRTQIYRALCACAANLRGVANRLKERGETDAAATLEDVAAGVLTMWDRIPKEDQR